MMKSLQALAFAMAAIAILPGTAKATLIGDEVTISFQSRGTTISVTGIAGVDPLAIVVSSSANTRFDPVFGESFIEIGFSTEFFSNAWFFREEVLVFSGLDWGESGFVIGATMIETVSDTGLIASDLIFTANSVTLDLNGVGLRNGETVRIDLVTQHSPTGPSAAVPEPASLLIFGLGLAGLAGVQRRLRKGKVQIAHQR